MQIADTPTPQSATLGLHSVAHISYYSFPVPLTVQAAELT